MTENIVPQKCCTKCGIEYPETPEYFHRGKGYKNGLSSWCRSCKRDYDTAKKRNRYQNNPQYAKKVKAQVAKYREANREKIREGMRKRYHLNPAKYIVAGKAYRQTEAGKAVIQAQRKRYYLNRPRSNEVQQRYLRQYRTSSRGRDITMIALHRHRAKKRGLPATLTIYHWYNCLNYWYYCCAVCGNQLRDLLGIIEPHLDHWIPIADGRPDNPGTTPENILCLCSNCNLSKNQKDAATWLISRYGKRKARVILDRIKTYFKWIQQQ